MSKNKKIKKNKLMWSSIILLGTLAIFGFLILYNDDVALKKTNSTEVIQKFKAILVKGGTFELTQNNIDEVNNLYFSKPKNKGDITLHGVNIEMINDELLIKVPISYKKIDLLFNTRGKINFSKGKITYVADNFQIGKLTLPKSLVNSQMSKLNNKIFYAENNSIKINPSVFPFKINSFKMKDNKIVGTATTLDIDMLFKDSDKKVVAESDKQTSTVDKKVEFNVEDMNSAKKEESQNNKEEVKDKTIEEKEKVISDVDNNSDKTIDKTSDSEKEKELQKIKAEVEKSKQAQEKKEKDNQSTQEQMAIKRIELNEVHDDLGAVYSQVQSSKEKQIISTLISAVGKLKSNPSYDSSQDKVSVKSLYSELDSDSKNRIKIVFFMNVDGDSIKELKQDFGI